MTAEQQSQIRELREAGCGYKKISILLNLPITTVQSYCKRKMPRKQESLFFQPHSGDDAEAVSTVTPPKQAKGICLFCGKPINLIEGKRHRMFCSGACRTAHWRKKAQGIPGERKCLGCGAPLDGRDPTRKYCARVCYFAHRFA